MSKFVNKTAFWFVATIATAFCLKYLHALSETHDLLIILSPAKPTAGMVSPHEIKTGRSGILFSKI